MLTLTVLVAALILAMGLTKAWNSAATAVARRAEAPLVTAR